MSGFAPGQLRKLTGKLDARHVQSREIDGCAIDYIEGWFALSEANAIFGFANWDREVVHFERLFERTRADMTTCAYTARVRISVRAGDHIVAREGTGCGTVSARSAGDAHERAIKAAETDATKRALATFGNRFGLCLYDKEKAGVAQRPTPTGLNILDPNGQILVTDLSPEGFCTGLRKILEAAQVPEVAGLWEHNGPPIARLRELAPGLVTQRGEHYAAVLERLFRARLPGPATAAVNANPPALPAADVEPAALLAPSRIAPGPRIDKAALTIKITRRLRDKAHLRAVGNLPCLICARQPCHAHHVRYAQTRGLGQKVSDEFVVPLCFLHHGELHRANSEKPWWEQHGLDPIAIAAELWAIRRMKGPTEKVA